MLKGSGTQYRTLAVRARQRARDGPQSLYTEVKHRAKTSPSMSLLVQVVATVRKILRTALGSSEAARSWAITSFC
ncbi:hypothetical protein AQJ66_36230 [Streptomyces bungoensis]|uniref:Uncharacterized protein n=1 Tax=Streptomyces bungoensis TaxID=285568 RepID=A0A101SJD1_9ACTN|nr:hypothetical protein AQJ66_36230 [Streptomyces bungoensis]